MKNKKYTYGWLVDRLLNNVFLLPFAKRSIESCILRWLESQIEAKNQIFEAIERYESKDRLSYFALVDIRTTLAGDVQKLRQLNGVIPKNYTISQDKQLLGKSLMQPHLMITFAHVDTELTSLRLDFVNPENIEQDDSDSLRNVVAEISSEINQLMVTCTLKLAETQADTITAHNSLFSDHVYPSNSLIADEINRRRRIRKSSKSAEVKEIHPKAVSANRKALHKKKFLIFPESAVKEDEE